RYTPLLNARPPKQDQSLSSSRSSKRDEVYANLDADKLLSEAGHCGLYQISTYVLCQFLNIFYSSSTFIMPFIQVRPNFTCEIANKSEQTDYCDTRLTEKERALCGSNVGNSQIIFDPSWKERSMLVEFDLLCSNPVVKEAGFCIFPVGAMLVVPIVSQFADLYGRRITLLVTLYLSVIFNILAAFAPNYIVFVILRFFVGATSDSYLTIASILSCEVIANESRPWTGLVYTIAWLLGYLYVGLLPQFIFTWRKLYLAMALPGLITIIYIFVLPESPYWLLAHGRSKSIRSYIKRSNWINRRKANLKNCCVGDKGARKAHQTKNRTFCDLLKWKRILFHIFSNGFITMVMSFYYYAISLDSVNLSDDTLTGYMLSGAVELPSGIIALPLLHFFGRRSVSVFALFIQGIVTLISSFARRWQWTRMTCDLLGKMINGVGFVSHPLLVYEMMPTTIRTISYSIINIPQSVGVMMSPLLQYTSYLTIASILSCEVIANESRPWTGLVYTIAWLLGYLYVGLLPQFIFTWRKLYLAMALPGLITIIYILMVMSFYYYAISLDSVNLSDDTLTGYMLSGAVELPSGIIALPLLHFFGRRSVSVFALFIQGIVTLISSFARSEFWKRGK
ncbi:Putative transporter, partial [Toxocara canis]